MMKDFLQRTAPTVVAAALIAGNVGLLLKRGLHPNLETAVGFLWIASDYALRQKRKHPVAAPRLNAAGVTAGSLLLSLSGLHGGGIDWPRVRAPLGYIPAAAVVGFQKELRSWGAHLRTHRSALLRAVGHILQHPYSLSAAINAYGVVELMESALHRQDHALVAIACCYGVATLALPLLDLGRNS